MRVLYITDPGVVGGATRALIEMTYELKKLGVEPVVCTSSYSELNDILNGMKIENYAIGHMSAMNTKSPYKWKRPLKYPYECLKYYLSIPKAIKNIKKNIDIKSIDVIHTNSARNDIGCILNRMYNVPHIMHIREFGYEDFDCCTYRYKYNKYISKYTNRFLAISKAVAKSWISRGVTKEKVQILYDGVDIHSIKIKNNYNNDNKLKMIIAGGVCEAKGQYYAIEASSYLPEQIKKNVYLDIAGWDDPKYLKKLEKLIKECELESQVKFLGARNDLYEIYKEYDVGLTCSRAEGFGRVTAEYMYAGLCVIGSNTGATPELIEDNKDGLIYDYQNIHELARCIERIYNDRELLRCLSENGKKSAIKFSSTRNAKEIYEVYLEILNEENK